MVRPAAATRNVVAPTTVTPPDATYILPPPSAPPVRPPIASPAPGARPAFVDPSAMSPPMSRGGHGAPPAPWNPAAAPPPVDDVYERTVTPAGLGAAMTARTPSGAAPVSNPARPTWLVPTVTGSVLAVLIVIIGFLLHLL